MRRRNLDFLRLVGDLDRCQVLVGKRMGSNGKDTSLWIFRISDMLINVEQ